MRLTTTPSALVVRALSIALPLAAIAGCTAGQQGDEARGTQVDALGSENGLKAINGMKANNGLATGTGLTIAAGLKTSAGLDNGRGLMSTADGRTTVAYLVRCALPAGHAISKIDQDGNIHTFEGQIGLAPEWESSACGQGCQRWVSACMLAMVNTTGAHYPLWMVAQSAAIGWGLDPTFPYQEGAFFGNIFASPPSAYFCGGRDFGVRPIPGRIGGVQDAAPYTDIYGARGLCAPVCTPADNPHAREGFKACSGWNEIVNVWHE
jgi:hypothetical protein